jgi:hypothetical protein
MPPKTPEDPEQNPYDLLGILQEATEAEIRTAYRTRSLKVHPDRVRQFISRTRVTRLTLLLQNRNDPNAGACLAALKM